MRAEEPERGAGRYHHGDLRRALLDAALEILREGGEVTLRAVARRAGVSHAAPYHHFADRRALVAAIAEEGLDAFRDALERAAAHGADPPAAMDGIGIAYVRFAVSNPAHFRLMFSAELSERGDLPALQTAFDRAYAVLLRGIRAAMGPDAAEEAVYLQATHAWSLVHGLSKLILDRQLARDADTPEEAEAFARRVLRTAVPHPRRDAC